MKIGNPSENFEIPVGYCYRFFIMFAVAKLIPEIFQRVPNHLYPHRLVLHINLLFLAKSTPLFYQQKFPNTIPSAEAT